MSYCRANGKDSDVYVVSTHHPEEGYSVWWCCGCTRAGHLARSREEMLVHLLDHREDGDKVPESALERLRREMQEEIDAE